MVLKKILLIAINITMLNADSYENKVGNKIVKTMNKELLNKELLNKELLNKVIEEKMKKNSFVIEKDEEKIYMLNNEKYIYKNNFLYKNKLITFLKKWQEDETIVKYIKNKHTIIVIKGTKMKHVKIPLDVKEININKLKLIIEKVI